MAKDRQIYKKFIYENLINIIMKAKALKKFKPWYIDT